jgi:23S rRNA pseudouridine2605 synthase
MGDDSGPKRSRRRTGARISSGARARPESARPESKSRGHRIAKLMARAGLCSRREAEAWIADGRVAVNGVALRDPAINIKQGDTITIDGKPVAPRARTRLFLFHKPRGLVTTARDPQGRATIFDYLREHWPEGPRVVSIGRLDINSEGLLLLSNDGGLARILELPATGWIRRYRVRANGQTSQAALDRLQGGVTIEGITYAGIEAKLDRLQGANCWLTMALREGKSREIKRVLDSVGLTVNRLIRISYGPFQLGDLAEGKIEEVRTRVLRDQLGPSLAKAAGVDFSSPLHGESKPKESGTISTPRSHPGSSRKRPLVPRPRRFDSPTDVKAKPGPRRRKHISVLRAKQDEKTEARKRIERGETADRAGRVVPVERLVSAETEKKMHGKRRSKKPADYAAGPMRRGKEGSLEKVLRQGRKKITSGNRPSPRAGSQKPRPPRRKT